VIAAVVKKNNLLGFNMQKQTELTSNPPTRQSQGILENTTLRSSRIQSKMLMSFVFCQMFDRFLDSAEGFFDPIHDVKQMVSDPPFKQNLIPRSLL